MMHGQKNVKTVRFVYNQ